MEQCHGKTKAGDRCKRSASDGSLYCSAHAGQAGDGAPEPEAPEVADGKCGDLDAVETFVAVAALGVAIIVVLKVGRLFRL
ncbi:MAG: hypothetical protein JJE01_14580 [Gemmatimonadetes bacterium]|nr:hypothetical protein [Gemmatimonadota bacterium]